MTRSSPTASRRAMSGGASCMVEQLGLAMMPSCSPASPGLTSTTTSGTAGSMRHCEELSMTSAPRRAASGARTAETDAPAEKRAMSTPSKASGVASDTAADADRTPVRARGQRTELGHGEAALGEDLDHRLPDDAGGADDRDGEGTGLVFGHGLAQAEIRRGTAG